MRYLQSFPLEDVVFIDVGTSIIDKDFKEDSLARRVWSYKKRSEPDINLEESYYSDVSFMPELSKLAYISVSVLKEGSLHTLLFKGDEKQMLKDFNNTINSLVSSNKKIRFAGFNVKIFDIPFILSRSIINNVTPCSMVDIGHLKPWEQTTVDLSDLWRASSIRGSSLLSVAYALGLEVSDSFYEYLITPPIERSEEVNEDIVLETIALTASIYLRFLNTNDGYSISKEDIKLKVVEKVKEDTSNILSYYFNTGTITKEQSDILLKRYNSLTEEEKKTADIIIKTIKKQKIK